MEWDTPAVVLAARPYGEGDALATVLTEPHGAHRGLARGGRRLLAMIVTRAGKGRLRCDGDGNQDRQCDGTRQHGSEHVGKLVHG